jgi:hypothetical protein
MLQPRLERRSILSQVTVAARRRLLRLEKSIHEAVSSCAILPRKCGSCCVDAHSVKAVSASAGALILAAPSATHELSPWPFPQV